ncbi:hypothetical protein MUK42_00539 [Musa troglodytarum]|uniref:Pentatricopeptide repeat-containing protein n=1 Tax=Musa troglodytarum TaxID=320322 RepID=A0A9E7JUM8_9LILI|nr:hypothetical protein MUK42_00539 [Musa troglodytarum]
MAPIADRSLRRSGGDRQTVRDSSPSEGLVETLVSPTADGPNFLDHRAYCVRRILKAPILRWPTFWIIELQRWRLLDQWRSPRNAMANQTLLFFTEACIRCWDVNSARQVFEEMYKPDGCAGESPTGFC